MASAHRGKRTAGYTVHLYEYSDAWKPDGSDEEVSFASLDYALLVAKRLKTERDADVKRRTSVRKDGVIVAEIKADGTVNLVQPRKPSNVLP